MNEFKGTPGPWVVDGQSNGARWNIDDAEGYAVAMSFQRPNDKGYEVRDANANLIAAAPDLLNVLTMGQTMQTPEFLHWIADRLVYVHGENANSDFIISLRKRADAAQLAIDKALGTNQ